MHDAMKAYHESWERELDRQFLKNDRCRKRADAGGERLDEWRRSGERSR